MGKEWIEFPWAGDRDFVRTAPWRASRRYHDVGLSGPNARELLSRVTRNDVSGDALKFRDIRRTLVGTVPAIRTRLSFSGELGYEIYMPAELAADGTWLEVETNGEMYAARVVAAPLRVTRRLLRH